MILNSLPVPYWFSSFRLELLHISAQFSSFWNYLWICVLLAVLSHITTGTMLLTTNNIVYKTRSTSFISERNLTFFYNLLSQKFLPGKYSGQLVYLFIFLPLLFLNVLLILVILAISVSLGCSFRYLFCYCFTLAQWDLEQKCLLQTGIQRVFHNNWSSIPSLQPHTVPESDLNQEYCYKWSSVTFTIH